MIRASLTFTTASGCVQRGSGVSDDQIDSGIGSDLVNLSTVPKPQPQERHVVSMSLHFPTHKTDNDAGFSTVTAEK